MRPQRHYRCLLRRWIAPLVGIAALAAPIALAGAVFAAPSVRLNAVAPSGTATTEADNGIGTLSLAVAPVTGLPSANASIFVQGSGFSDGTDLWVAVCEDGSGAPAILDACLGGPIPDHNGSSAWGIVSYDPAQYAGPVVTTWVGGNSFQIGLQLPGASGSHADCVNSSCSVYVRSADANDRSQDIRIPLKFAKPQPPKPTKTTTAKPTTTTVGAIPTTVDPDQIAETSVAIGDTQTVQFSGFKPGEDLQVTVYSDPIGLDGYVADGSGKVTVSFDITEELGIGRHILEVIGQESARTGLATFQVIAAEETADQDEDDDEAELTTEITMTELPVADDDNVSDNVVDADSGSDEGLILDEEPPTDDAGDDGQLIVDEEEEVSAAGSGLRWLWLTLVTVVIVGGAAAGMVLWSRRSSGDHSGPAAPGSQPQHTRAPDRPFNSPTADYPRPVAGAPSSPPAAPAPQPPLPGDASGSLPPPAGSMTYPVGPGPAAQPPVLPGLEGAATPHVADGPPVLFSHSSEGHYASWAQHRLASDAPTEFIPATETSSRTADSSGATAQNGPTPTAQEENGPATEQWFPDFSDQENPEQ